VYTGAFLYHLMDMQNDVLNKTEKTIQEEAAQQMVSEEFFRSIITDTWKLRIDSAQTARTLNEKLN